MVDWHDLVALIVHVSMNEKEDEFVWKLNKNGYFSIQSLYKNFMSSERIATEKYILKG